MRPVIWTIAPWHWILELPAPPTDPALALELELVRIGRRTVGWWRLSQTGAPLGRPRVAGEG